MMDPESRSQFVAKLGPEPRLLTPVLFPLHYVIILYQKLENQYTVLKKKQQNMHLDTLSLLLKPVTSGSSDRSFSHELNGQEC